MALGLLMLLPSVSWWHSELIPKLPQAFRGMKTAGWAHVVLDGTAAEPILGDLRQALNAISRHN
jgi:hypothetical protein